MKTVWIDRSIILIILLLGPELLNLKFLSSKAVLHSTVSGPKLFILGLQPIQIFVKLFKLGYFDLSFLAVARIFSYDLLRFFLDR